MTNKKAAVGIAFEPLISLVLAALVITGMMGGTYRFISSDRVDHIQATKSAALALDAMTSLKGNAQYAMTFNKNFSIVVSGNKVSIFEEKEHFERYSHFNRPNNTDITVETGYASRWYITKNGNSISIAKAPDDVTTSELCKSKTTFQSYSSSNEGIFAGLADLFVPLVETPTVGSVDLVRDQAATYVKVYAPTYEDSCTLIQDFRSQGMTVASAIHPYQHVQVHFNPSIQSQIITTVVRHRAQ